MQLIRAVKSKKSCQIKKNPVRYTHRAHKCIIILYGKYKGSKKLFVWGAPRSLQLQPSFHRCAYLYVHVKEQSFFHEVI